MNRLLIFHYHDAVGSTVRMAPSAYYMDADYEKVSVRIYAEKAPKREAEIDIYDDGVSIFNNRATTHINVTTGVRTVGTSKTSATLLSGQNLEEIAEDFTDSIIGEGSWVYCNLIDAGGGSNFTVQLELRQVSEDE